MFLSGANKRLYLISLVGAPTATVDAYVIQPAFYERETIAMVGLTVRVR